MFLEVVFRVADFRASALLVSRSHSTAAKKFLVRRLDSLVRVLEAHLLAKAWSDETGWVLILQVLIFTFALALLLGSLPLSVVAGFQAIVRGRDN